MQLMLRCMMNSNGGERHLRTARPVLTLRHADFTRTKNPRCQVSLQRQYWFQCHGLLKVKFTLLKHEALLQVVAEPFSDGNKSTDDVNIKYTMTAHSHTQVHSRSAKEFSSSKTPPLP